MSHAGHIACFRLNCVPPAKPMDRRPNSPSVTGLGHGAYKEVIKAK